MMNFSSSSAVEPSEEAVESVSSKSHSDRLCSPIVLESDVTSEDEVDDDALDDFLDDSLEEDDLDDSLEDDDLDDSLENDDLNDSLEECFLSAVSVGTVTTQAAVS